MNINDIARLAGVSKASVSRVINNGPNVSIKLREKVERVLDECDYTPNLIAKELNTKQTKLVGVIIPSIGIDIFSEITDGISDVLQDYDYNIILGNSKENIKKELEYVEVFKRKQVDGIIYFPSYMTEEHVNVMGKLKIPTIMLGLTHEKLKHSSVIFDDFNASKAIVEDLVKKGHKKIVNISMQEDKAIGNLRSSGYIEAMKSNDNSTNVYVEYSESLTYGAGYNAMENIISNSLEFTAVFCAMDRLAIGAIRCLKDHGYRVPEEISVVGIDDMEVSRVCDPCLSTVSFDYYDAGKKAADLLMNEIGHNVSPKSIVINYELINRKSVMEVKNG